MNRPKTSACSCATCGARILLDPVTGTRCDCTKGALGLEVFFYLLGRDALPLGQVEALIERMRSPGPTGAVAFSNPHLAAWAKAQAHRFTGDA